MSPGQQRAFSAVLRCNQISPARRTRACVPRAPVTEQLLSLDQHRTLYLAKKSPNWFLRGQSISGDAWRPDAATLPLPGQHSIEWRHTPSTTARRCRHPFFQPCAHFHRYSHAPLLLCVCTHACPFYSVSLLHHLYVYTYNVRMYVYI